MRETKFLLEKLLRTCTRYNVHEVEDLIEEKLVESCECWKIL